MNKLYGLYIVIDKGGEQKLLAGSNNARKLTAITPACSFIVGSDPHDETLVLKTPANEYPIYLVREPPYVC